MTVKYTIHPIYSDPDEAPMWVLLPDDETDGFVVGEDAEMEGLIAVLGRWRQGDHGEQVDEQSHRLGRKWLTSGEAMDLADEMEMPVALSSITHACRRGHIRNAEKRGRDWVFSQSRFLSWLHNRPKPGRKPAE